jgi:hypothetical protein
MRKWWQLTGVLMLLAVLPAGAQQPLTVQGARSMVGTMNAQPIKFQVVDTSKAIAPVNNIANSFRPPRPPATFTLSRFFPKITAGPWPPKLPDLLSVFKSPKTPTVANPQAAFHFPQAVNGR